MSKNETTTVVTVATHEIELLIDGLCALEDLDTGYVQERINALKAKLAGWLRQC